MMRKVGRFIFFPGAVLVLSASIAPGQVMETPKTPPQKITVRGTGTTAPKDFVSAEGEFKISFPAPPQIEQSAGSLPEGVTARAGFTASFLGRVYYVRYEDRSNFPDIVEPLLLKSLYDQVRDGLAKMPNATLISDKDIAIGDRRGREAVLHIGEVEVTNRMFLVGGRFYQVITGAPKNIANEKTVVEERQKFFDSLVITRAIPAAATIPENYRGKVENGVYRNEYFDFSIELIPSWRTLSEDETSLLTEGTKDNFRGKDGTLAPGVDRNLRQTAFLLMQRRYPFGTKFNPALQFTVETTNSPRRPLRDTALLGQKTLQTLKKDPFVVTKEITDTVLGGEKFVVYEALNGPPEHQYKQRIFMGSRKGLIFMIVISYVETDDLSNMEKSLATLKFGKK